MSTRRGDHARCSLRSIQIKKRYSNARSGRMGFKSAANVADKNKMESDELKITSTDSVRPQGRTDSK